MHLLQFQTEKDIGSGLRMHEKMYENGSQMYLVDGLSLYHCCIKSLCLRKTQGSWLHLV
jgi:hypothetical protein